MHPSEVQFLQTGQYLTATAVQAAQAMNQAQSELELDQVLSYTRLCSTEGTSASLATLERLADFMSKHKAAFEAFVTNGTAHLMSALSAMPDDRRRANEAGLVESINWNLNAQGAFYLSRERWISAATQVCHLIESRRALLSFSEGVVAFPDDEDVETFARLMNVIEEVHQEEVRAVAEREQRVRSAVALLAAATA